MEWKACCHVANAFLSIWLGDNLAHVQAPGATVDNKIFNPDTSKLCK